MVELCFCLFELKGAEKSLAFLTLLLQHYLATCVRLVPLNIPPTMSFLPIFPSLFLKSCVPSCESSSRPAVWSVRTAQGSTSPVVVLPCAQRAENLGLSCHACTRQDTRARHLRAVQFESLCTPSFVHLTFTFC